MTTFSPHLEPGFDIFKPHIPWYPPLPPGAWLWARVVVVWIWVIKLEVRVVQDGFVERKCKRNAELCGVSSFGR